MALLASGLPLLFPALRSWVRGYDAQMGLRLERPAALLPALRWIHDALTYVLGFLVVGHIALATLHPRTRPALRGMLDGRVPAEWAARHYPRWMPEAKASPTGSGGDAGTPA